MQANVVIVAGRVCKELELRYTPSSKAVVNISLAINNTYGKGEDQKKDTVFIEVVVWETVAENCSKYLQKGSPLYVEGRLSQDNYQDKEGKNRSKIKIIATKVQFLGQKKEETQDAI